MSRWIHEAMALNRNVREIEDTFYWLSDLFTEIPEVTEAYALLKLCLLDWQSRGNELSVDDIRLILEFHRTEVVPAEAPVRRKR